MTEKESKYALISVTDKSGVVEFAAGLARLGYSILSTGGSAALLREKGVPHMEVATYTQSPEILTGRVKTLHPKIHGGILFDRGNPDHVREAAAMGIQPIDIVVVNLYAFEKKALEQRLDLAKAIEFIDVGGPTMLRAAAKNWRFCLPVIDPADYAPLLLQLEAGDVPHSCRVELAGKVFAATAKYDAMIAGYFSENAAAARKTGPTTSKGTAPPAESDPAQPKSTGELAGEMSLHLTEAASLRYGENPHQNAKFYRLTAINDQGNLHAEGLAAARVLQGKELSYNNILDCDGAIALVMDFSHASCVAIIKHTNACGVAIGNGDTLKTIYQKALASDPKSAFGGIIATNETIDEATALAMSATFFECIAAPGFSDGALKVFAQKKNLRLLVVPMLDRLLGQKSQGLPFALRSVSGGILVQSRDTVIPLACEFQTVTKQAPPPERLDDLAFAMTIAKHVKSNAIVYARDHQVVSVGAGQMSRIDAAAFAAQKAHFEGRELKGAVMASDAFFPFRDTVDLAARWGISAIVQPGGSLRDKESINACNEHGIAMVFTGKRHFKH